MMKGWKTLCSLMAVVLLAIALNGCRHGTKPAKTSGLPLPSTVRLG